MIGVWQKHMAHKATQRTGIGDGSLLSYKHVCRTEQQKQHTQLRQQHITKDHDLHQLGAMMLHVGIAEADENPHELCPFACCRAVGCHFMT